MIEPRALSVSLPAQAEAVDGPLIPIVVDRRVGAEASARDLLSGERSKVMELRAEVEAGIVRGEPALLCAACMTPVKIRASVLRRFFLRHLDESGQCEFKTRGALDQETINAIRYQGQKEGRAHRELKALIADSLRADPRFSEPQLETTWKGLWGPGSFRRPDVQATCNGIRFAFEIQLSTTYVDVIAARREFYLREGGLLFWIFRSIDAHDRRLMIDDIFVPNNHNLFVADAETLAESRRAGSLTLRCFYHVPVVRDGTLMEEWYGRLVRLDELTIDQGRQRVYFFDYEGARAKVAQTDQAKHADLRRDVQRFWLSIPVEYPEIDQDAVQREYGNLRSRLAHAGIETPWAYRDLHDLMKMLYSAALGRPVGLRFSGNSALLQVAHWAFDRHKGHLYPFILLLDKHGGSGVLAEGDSSGKWAQRRRDLERAWQGGHPQSEMVPPPFKQDALMNRLIAFLFPQISGRLLD